MPCYDHRNSLEHIEADTIEPLRKNVRRLSNRCHKYARLLCEATKTGIPDNASPELKQWVREHRAFDKKRRSKKNAGKTRTIKRNKGPEGL